MVALSDADVSNGKGIWPKRCLHADSGNLTATRHSAW